MNSIEISVNRANKAVVAGWVAFGVSLLVALLITLAFWFYSELPMLLEMLAEEEGMPGMFTMDMIDPVFFDMFYSGIWGAVAFAAVAIFAFGVFWWRWLSRFIDNRHSRRMGGHVACISSLIPIFGVFVNYFVLLDAIAVLESELAEQEQKLQGVVSKFVLWFWTALVTLGFLTFCEFNYWLIVLFVELLCFVCFYRYIRLISTLAREERKLLL